VIFVIPHKCHQKCLSVSELLIITAFFRGVFCYIMEQVHRIDFDDDNNAISKTTFVHADGELWGIGSSTVSRNVISTIYNHGKVYSSQCASKVYAENFSFLLQALFMCKHIMHLEKLVLY
jgi:hypothetical protein